MTQMATAVVAALAIAAGLGTAPQKGGWHEDSRCGFKIKPPKDWEQVPLKVDEGWQVAKYLSKREYFWTDKEDGRTRTHKPQMTAIAFVERVEEEEPDADEEGDDDEVTIIVLKNPYANYKDYLKRTYTGGGYYISAEEAATVNGVEVTQLEIKVERGSYDGPKRIATWVYHLEGLDLAVQLEVLETEWDKLKRTVLGTLKSLKTIPRTGELPGNESLSEKVLTYFEMDRLSDADRRIKRQQLEERLHERARADVPEGWTAEDMGRFLVLNHCSEKVARRMVERSGAVLDFLDERFPYIGRDEYVRRPILRICKDWDEENSYRRGGDGWFSLNDLEIVTHDDQMGSVGSWKGEWLSRRVVYLWFTDRDRDLFWAFPNWLRQGFENSFANALPKRKKLEFRKDDWDRDELRQRVREGAATPPRELIRMGQEQFFGARGGGFWDRQREAGALVRFFLSGEARKSSKSKNVLDDYIKNLKLVVDRIDEDKGEGKSKKKPQTEEEEDEYFRKRRAAWKEKEREILDEVFERTFRSWSDKDWAAFDKVYFKSIS